MRLESTLRSRRSFLHLASLIDIVFLLLLFFLLSSDAIVRSGIAVRTPSWEENEDDNADDENEDDAGTLCHVSGLGCCSCMHATPLHAD